MASCGCRIKAGELRHEIVIQAENATTDAGGGGGDPWASPTTVATIMASIRPLRGRERLQAMQAQDSLSHVFTARWISGITPKHRILFGTRTFNIRAVINVEERDQKLEIFAEEGVGT